MPSLGMVHADGQMREFIRSSSGLDIGADGVSFLVAGLRQGVADIAALPTTVFAECVVSL